MTSLTNLLASVNGASFISIDTATPVKLKGGKSNPLQGLVQKIVKGSSVMVFQNKKSNGYENMVKRRLIDEGKMPEAFVLGERTWGERIKDTPFVEHKGELYLEVIFLKAGKVEYKVGDEIRDPKTITGLDEGGSEGAQGGLDNKVIIRTYKVNNITAITVDGARHQL